MNIKSFTFNPFQENTYVVYDESKECIIIDPGCYTTQEQEDLKRFIEEKALAPVKLINTHCHIDHVLGNKFASEQWDIQLHMHKEDLPVLEKVGDIGKMYVFFFQSFYLVVFIYYLYLFYTVKYLRTVGSTIHIY